MYYCLVILITIYVADHEILTNLVIITWQFARLLFEDMRYIVFSESF